jgi:polyphosphate kinase 2 (PPK2 family)
MLVLKFFLNVSPDEQRRRFLDRIDEPDKNWKFSATDVRERQRWPDYMHAYEEALNATSRAWAPWYAIPADDKHFMRLTVAEIVAASLERLDLHYPEVDDAVRARLQEMRDLLDGDHEK